MPREFRELSVKELRRVCDPSIFDFKSTAELPDLGKIIGQDRAVRATSFGIDIESPGYHIFALGPAGTGKTSMIKELLDHKSASKPVPDDWCYINNFEDPGRPRVLRLPAGKGRRFQRDMDQFVEKLGSEITNAFETKDYVREREKIEARFQGKRQALFEELEKATASKDFALLQTPRGIALAPVVNGDVITPEQFKNLSDKQSDEIEKRQSELQGQLRQTIRRVQELEDETQEEIHRLDEEVVGYAVEHLINKIREKYTGLESVAQFLEQVTTDILKNVDAFKQARERREAQQLPFLGLQLDDKPNFDRYRINLLVDNSATKGAPVVFESNPTYPNLLGRVEQQARFGALVTDFRMIKAGALHRANGGYLIIDVRDVLVKPMAWDGLKRALQDREIRIESVYESLGAISTRSLDPEPIPLDVKVVIIGDPMIYYLLYNLDEDMRDLFKVKADFAIHMDWSGEALRQYAQFIGDVCRRENLLAFAPTGVAQIIEESARMVSHQGRLATKFRDVVDLIRQSSYWAGKNGHEYVQDSDVRQAVDEQIYRSNQLEEYIQAMIEEGTILIDTHGKTVGQVNGISILPVGDYTFGKPSRITARTHAGSAGVINIDREIELGGRIHNKGVMILTGYLGEKFAQDIPLAFSASLTFEQTYDEIDGDSASSAELYALLSSLSGHPIRQDLAVTGSVNQRGQIQAIGGVNEKVEGFFEVCKSQGLTGTQGALIPESNVKNLMLRQEVIQAVREGKFHIYPVSTIDEGIELLTGVEAGEPDAQGRYPENTVSFAVQARLTELAEKVRAFTRPGKNEQKEYEYQS